MLFVAADSLESAVGRVHKRVSSGDKEVDSSEPVPALHSYSGFS